MENMGTQHKRRSAGAMQFLSISYGASFHLLWYRLKLCTMHTHRWKGHLFVSVIWCTTGWDFVTKTSYNLRLHWWVLLRTAERAGYMDVLKSNLVLSLLCRWLLSISLHCNFQRYTADLQDICKWNSVNSNKMHLICFRQHKPLPVPLLIS